MPPLKVLIPLSYEYVNGQLSTSCMTFSSINELSNYLGVARETLNVYLNT